MLRPLFARVILKREKLNSSIIIPDDARRRHAPAKGKIVAVGGTCDDEIQMMLGKTVLFGQHAGAWINADGTPSSGEDGEYFVCMDEDLIAEVEND